jgi:hypothetical protein
LSFGVYGFPESQWISGNYFRDAEENNGSRNETKHFYFAKWRRAVTDSMIRDCNMTSITALCGKEERRLLCQLFDCTGDRNSRTGAANYQVTV